MRASLNYGSIARVLKTKAIELLGGSVASAARRVGVTYQAVDKWPDELPRRIEDRVLAALARQRLPELVGRDDKAGAPPKQEVRDAA